MMLNIRIRIISVDNVDYTIKVKKNTVVNYNVLFLMLGRRLIMAGKIFYRERRKVKDGEKKPRFRMVGVFDCNLKVYAKHLRLSELEHLAEEAQAELIFLRKGGREGRRKES